MAAGDPVSDAFERAGIHVERREAGPYEQMIASGVGGIVGTALAAAAGSGWIGRALASLGGSIVGHLAITHRVIIERPGDDRRRPVADGPDAPSR
jgi:hypothetical protein